MTEPSTDGREDFTDIVLSIDGDHGLDDPVVMRALDVAVPQIEKLLGCDVVVSSHHCNDDGETFRTVSAERDALRAQVEAVRAVMDIAERAAREPFDFMAVQPFILPPVDPSDLVMVRITNLRAALAPTTEGACDRGPCHLPRGHEGRCNPGGDAIDVAWLVKP